MRICIIEDCEIKHYAKGYCNKHWNRAHNHGDANIVLKKTYHPRKFKTIIDQFNCKYRICSNGCWEWNAATHNKGYGLFRITENGKNKIIRAHRFSYENYIGKIPKNMFICHKCDNPSCVNPEHLFIGSPKDNSQDMAKKKRSTFGERNPQAKLTEKEVKQIKLMLKKGISSPKIANKYGITSGAVRSIATQRIWSHVECL